MSHFFFVQLGKQRGHNSKLQIQNFVCIFPDSWEPPLVMFGHRQRSLWIHRHLSPESLHHILTILLHLCIHQDLFQLLDPELLQPAQVCGLPGTLQPDPLLPSRSYHDSFKPVPPAQSQSHVPPAAGH